jgi:hypothetical protein
MHLVGYLCEAYHDARSLEHKVCHCFVGRREKLIPFSAHGIPIAHKSRNSQFEKNREH